MTFHRNSKPTASFEQDQRIGKSEEAASNAAALAPIKVPFHEKNLMQVEFALQLYFLQNKTNSISYEQFCLSLAPKLVLEPPASLPTTPATRQNIKKEGSAEDDNDPELVSDIQKLTRDDRLWHDLSCILVPQVYNTESPINATSESPTSVAKAADKMFTTTTLVRRENSKQNIGLVKQLISEASSNGLDKSRSREVIRKINQDKHYLLSEKEKTKKEKARGKAASDEAVTSNTANGPNAIIKPGMTLEDRVRARAAQRDQAVEKAAKNEGKDKAIDLVRVADALFSHARLLIRKRTRKLQQNRLLKASTTMKAESSTCVVLLQDLLPAIPNMGRQQISRYIVLLSKDYPELIRWKNPKGYRPREEKLSRNATVWLETGDYQKVRAKISGEATNPDNQVSPAIRRLNFALPGTASISGQKRSSSVLGRDGTVPGSKRRST